MLLEPELIVSNEFAETIYMLQFKKFICTNLSSDSAAAKGTKGGLSGDLGSCKFASVCIQTP